VDIIFLS